MLRPRSDHKILEGFSVEDVQQLADENPSMRGYLQGYLAELKLKQLLMQLPGVASVQKIPDSASSKADFLVEYKYHQLLVEAKSCRHGSSSFNVLTQSWHASVECKNPTSRVLDIPGLGKTRATCVEEGRFDVLAVCTHPVTGEWGVYVCPRDIHT